MTVARPLPMVSPSFFAGILLVVVRIGGIATAVGAWWPSHDLFFSQMDTLTFDVSGVSRNNSDRSFYLGAAPCIFIVQHRP